MLQNFCQKQAKKKKINLEYIERYIRGHEHELGSFFFNLNHTIKKGYNIKPNFRVI